MILLLEFIRLGPPKVDIKCAGTTTPDPIPRDARLLREEYISLLYFGHNIGVPLDF
jgi:hypothetical protein